MGASLFVAFAIWLGCLGCSDAKAPPPRGNAFALPWVFQTFDDEDPTELVTAVTALREVALRSDLTLDPHDRAVTLPPLDGDALGRLSFPSGARAEDQIPVAHESLSPQPFATHRALAIEPNRVCLEPRSTVWARRAFTTSAECFGRGRCERLAYEQPTRVEGALVEVWMDVAGEYRSIAAGSGESPTDILVHRHRIDESAPSDTGLAGVQQRFGLEITMPASQPDETLVVRAEWSSLDLTALDPLELALHQVDRFSEQHALTEQFLVEGACDLDREASPPPRP